MLIFSTSLLDEFSQGKKYSFKTILFSLNLVLILFGYQIFVSIISAFLGHSLVLNSSVFTWPIRGFCIGITILSILLGQTKNKRLSIPIILFIILMVMYFIKALIALQILPLPPCSPVSWNIEMFELKLKSWYCVILGIISVISIYRTWKQIDYPLAVNLSLLLGALALLMAAVGILKGGNALIGIDSENRVGASNMLNTISLGHFGVSMLLIAIFKFFYSKKLVWKILTIPIMLLAFLIALRAGSRSPIAALAVVFTLWISFSTQNLLINISICALSTLIAYLMRFQIVGLINIISPTTALRLEASLLYGESSGRDWLFEDYFNYILDHPLFSSHIDIFGYSHNLFLDSYVMYGVILGNILPVICIVAICYVINILKNKEYFSVIAVLFLQMFTFCMFSGCWGSSSQIQCLLFLILLYRNETYNNKILLKINPKIQL